MTGDERLAHIEERVSSLVYQDGHSEELRFLLRLLNEARAEIARLQAPLDADAMEVAFQVLEKLFGDTFDRDFQTSAAEVVARAITAARLNADELGYRRGVEEAAQIASSYCGSEDDIGPQQMAGRISNAIRALATKEQP